MKDIKTEWGKIYSEENILLYEGHVLKGKPCGECVSYFHNGNKY